MESNYSESVRTNIFVRSNVHLTVRWRIRRECSCSESVGTDIFVRSNAHGIVRKEKKKCECKGLNLIARSVQ